jgi:hypothetical protein
MVVALYRVMVSIEDPFDSIGSDDINMGMLSEVFQHMFES